VYPTAQATPLIKSFIGKKTNGKKQKSAVPKDDAFLTQPMTLNYTRLACAQPIP
jgi:hypothetical protein